MGKHNEKRGIMTESEKRRRKIFVILAVVLVLFIPIAITRFSISRKYITVSDLRRYVESNIVVYDRN